MAKKSKRLNEEQQRQSRKEVLLARRQEQQTRQVRLAVLSVVGLLALVFAIGIVNELAIKPTQPVATVNGVEIAMRDWQQRVRLQRAQLIMGIEDLAESVGQDIGLVQQFAGQQMNLLFDSETFGQIVLDEMIDEVLVEQAAVARGIVVSESDVEREIEESFNYFGGASPTALPTATTTVMPTPSLTPLPTAVITEVLPTGTPLPTPTLGPTRTPLPTATAVSSESFQETLDETLRRFDRLGTSKETYRSFIRARVFEERLLEELAAEAELSDEALMVSLFYVSFDDEAEAADALERLAQEDYLSYWNAVRSLPADDESDVTATASELLWRTRENLVSLLGLEVSEAAFDLAIGEPSSVLVETSTTEEGADRYFIIQVSGREIRKLSQGALANEKQQILTSWLEGQRVSGVQVFERWRANVPDRPVLDPRFLVPPTPTPLLATVPSVPEVAPTVEE